MSDESETAADGIKTVLAYSRMPPSWPPEKLVQEAITNVEFHLKENRVYDIHLYALIVDLRKRMAELERRRDYDDILAMERLERE